MIKSENDFAKNLSKKDGLQTYCRPCKKIYDANEYQQNKHKQFERNNKNKKRYKDKIDEYKSSIGCSKCGEKEACCLDFHHLEESNKIANVSRLRIVSQKKAWKEIEKCIVICANCHRKLHSGKLI
jgi:hypothetical protein